MSVEVVDGATIRDFVEDEPCFNVSVDDRFATLDTDRDGLLSYEEMVEELRSLRVLGTHLGAVDEVKPTAEELIHVYRSLFSQFDHDGSGTIDLEEFRAEMRRMLLGVANGLGFLPVQMVVEEGSFLRRAVDRESAKVAT